MTEIIKGKLYLGSIDDANNIDFLETNNISAIITVAHCCEVSPAIKDCKRVHKFNIVDFTGEDIGQYFQEIHDLIEREGCVLVHCVAGMSRSPTIVISYLMSVYHMNLLEAWKLVKTKRPCVKPNTAFVKQLLDYDYNLYFKNSVEMKDIIGNQV